MDSVSTFFRIEDDIWYKKGFARGFAKGFARGFAKGFVTGLTKSLNDRCRLLVENCFVKGFTDEFTAEIVGVELSFVKEVRASKQVK